MCDEKRNTHAWDQQISSVAGKSSSTSLFLHNSKLIHQNPCISVPSLWFSNVTDFDCLLHPQKNEIILHPLLRNWIKAFQNFHLHNPNPMASHIHHLVFAYPSSLLSLVLRLPPTSLVTQQLIETVDLSRRLVSVWFPTTCGEQFNPRASFLFLEIPNQFTAESKFTRLQNSVALIFRRAPQPRRVNLDLSFGPILWSRIFA
jgi:hypothetical protein